jgi:hypothetical protein
LGTRARHEEKIDKSEARCVETAVAEIKAVPNTFTVGISFGTAGIGSRSRRSGADKDLP